MGSKRTDNNRADLKDQAAVFIARWSLPSLVIMVGAMIYSASGDHISGDAIGIVSALITSVCMGLISVLSNMKSEKDDPMHDVAKSLIAGLERSEERSAAISDALIQHIQRSKSTELCIDDKTITIDDGETKASVRKGKK